VRDITIADWNKFGAIIKADRTRLALSQHKLAARAGVSRSWLAKEASASAHRASLDTTAMQELMEKRQRSAEIRRRAWSADELQSTRSDHG
jgi:HTH-type transcriptional regulator / antitoxin HipB